MQVCKMLVASSVENVCVEGRTEKYLKKLHTHVKLIPTVFGNMQGRKTSETKLRVGSKFKSPKNPTPHPAVVVTEQICQCFTVRDQIVQ